MAKTLETTLQLTLNGNYVDSDDLNSSRGNLIWTLTDTLANGSGADQANLMWYDTRTLAATSEDLDLWGITDVFNDTIYFGRVKALIIENTSETDDLYVGGASSNAWATWVGDATDKVKIRPGGFMLLWAPDAIAYNVIAGTGDKLKIDAGSATITYNIAIIGTTGAGTTTTSTTSTTSTSTSTTTTSSTSTSTTTTTTTAP